ncbi:MAG TPA: hypothetical protein VK666_01680 [Chryseolinea sp.]|nr:hypothetical protein [Chryseolinea sp.]
MKFTLSLAIILFSVHLIFAQGHGFSFGQTSYGDLDMKIYSRDTAAVAVVLNEFAEAYINDDRDFGIFLKSDQQGLCYR